MAGNITFWHGSRRGGRVLAVAAFVAAAFLAVPPAAAQTVGQTAAPDYENDPEWLEELERSEEDAEAFRKEAEAFYRALTEEPYALAVAPEPAGPVEYVGAMLDAICVAGRLERQAIGPLIETWTRRNTFELVKHYRPQAADASQQEGWDMRKDGRTFAVAFLELSEEDGPKKACRVVGLDVDPVGVRDHLAARYRLPQPATDAGDETLVASWTAGVEGYAREMTIRVRKIGPVVDVWFRE